MKEAAKGQLFIPPSLAMGERGAGSAPLPTTGKRRNDISSEQISDSPLQLTFKTKKGCSLGER
jgi:hypothetical protein